MFFEYQHIERLGNIETEGILEGTVFVFPKIDGTNSHCWKEDTGEIQFGSRTRTLSEGSDNAGFLAQHKLDERIVKALELHPEWHIFGEWLVKHTLATYRDDAWRKMYVYDVHNGQKYIHFDLYNQTLLDLGFDVIQPLAIINNPKVEQLYEYLEKNTYLIQDGKGVGEGVVLKNYDYTNCYGRQTWAKIVRTEFKEQNQLAFKRTVLEGGKVIENDIVDKFITETLVNKTYDKLVIINHGFSGKDIPRLLETVWYDFIREEMWDLLKKFKNPKIDFNVLYKKVIKKIKELRPELF